MTDLTELTNDPKVVKGTAEANRWQNYGKDRVYLNNNDFSGKYDAYIDLETGEFVCEYSSNFRMEIEDGTAKITKHWTGNGEEYSKVVVIVDLFETGDDSKETADDNEASDSGQKDVNNRSSAVVAPDDVHEDYKWLYEGRRFHNYRFDYKRYDGKHTLGVQQFVGPGILWHKVTITARDDGAYDAKCSCQAFANNGECSHTHAVIAKREHTYEREKSEDGVSEGCEA